MLNFETFLDINKNFGILFIANEKMNQRIGFSNNWPTLIISNCQHIKIVSSYNVHDALHFVNNSNRIWKHFFWHLLEMNKYIIVDNVYCRSIVAGVVLLEMRWIKAFCKLFGRCHRRTHSGLLGSSWSFVSTRVNAFMLLIDQVALVFNSCAVFETSHWTLIGFPSK